MYVKKILKRIAVAAAVVVLSAHVVLAQGRGNGNGGGGNSGGGGGETPNGQILYWYGGDTFKMNADGTGKTIVSSSLYSSDEPSYATHDGNRWFLQTPPQGLVAIRDDGAQINLVTDPIDGDITEGQWVGTTEAFADAMVSWREIYTSGEMCIVLAPLVYDTNGQLTGVDLTAAEYFPDISGNFDWSPDGTQIAFIDGNLLWTFDTSTQEFSLLPTIATYRPSWSPDGRQIVYELRPGDHTTSIETIDLETGTVKTIASGKNSIVCIEPHWSPDGKYLVYNKYNANGSYWDYAIIRCKFDGKASTNLTNDVSYTFPPSDLKIMAWGMD